tara:strand:- start:474 stop:740 length:267 start_codon:yes stop_codon:yes gene_type:complete
MDNEIPKDTHSIEAYYSECISFDLYELEIDIGSVSEWYIKYQILHVTFKDGTQAEYSCTHNYDTDFKRADSLTFLDKDRVELKETKGD